MILFWFICIIATLVIADQKKLSLGTYLILALLLGPLALLIVLMVSGKSVSQGRSVEDMRGQLNQLKGSVLTLQQKINSLERSLGAVSVEPGQIEGELQPQDEKTEAPQVAAEPVPKDKKRIDLPKIDMEINFGRNWLNKIGIVIFTLGMGFLISYTFKYFGPFMKILFGYCVGAVLFYWGTKLRNQEKLISFGRVVLGGAWAVVYFTTYAMHHFEASRIIHNQMVDLFLLGLVVVGMILHVLKYKSEGMMSLAIFVAYVTATLGQITSFTFISCLLLALVVLFLMYKFQWIKTFIMGVILTYGIHHIWVMPRIVSSPGHAAFLGITTTQYHVLVNFVFLTAYWLVFLAGAHLSRAFKEPKLVDTLAAINFGNIAFYSALAYPMVLRLFYAQRFILVLATGILYLFLAVAMKKIHREKLYLSDMVAAIFVITFALPLKFATSTTMLAWLIEVPFLVLISFYFKEKIYRVLGYLLSVFVTFRLIFLAGLDRMADVHFLGLVWSWSEFMSLWACITMGASFTITRCFDKAKEYGDGDEVFGHIFSISSCVYLTFLIASMVEQPYLAFALSIEGVVLLALSLLLSIHRYRNYAYLILGSAACIFTTEKIFASTQILQWLIVGSDVMIFFAVYFTMKGLLQSKKIKRLFVREEAVGFWIGLFLLVVAIFRYASPQWISLSLGLAGVLIVLIGIVNEDKTERLGGLMVLGLTLARIFLVDLSGLDIIFKIITFMVLGVLCVGVSFIYNRFNIGQKE